MGWLRGLTRQSNDVTDHDGAFSVFACNKIPLLTFSHLICLPPSRTSMISERLSGGVLGKLAIALGGLLLSASLARSLVLSQIRALLYR